ncbi:MAG: prolyl oligopeptidase family serine peptidase [Acidobacteria bacterium]|nr:prolyl oligopeptidase family serine peptidase [Acidobacteriota bacterium]
MRKFAGALALTVLAATAQTPPPEQPGPGSSGPRPFDFFALSRIARVSDPQLSPDGAFVAFVAERVLLTENSTVKQIYVVPAGGGDPKQLTFEGESNRQPRWSPDSQRIFYLSDRSGSGQIWAMDSAGLGAAQISNLSVDVTSFAVSPTGDRLVYAARVFPECRADDACNARRLEQAENNPVKARVYDGLLYRHWDEWQDDRRSHLFSWAFAEDGAEAIDLTPGHLDAPPFTHGGPDSYAISPDGLEVCFTRSADDGRPAQSTNTDLFVTPIDGSETPRAITENPAADASPRYSPDGRYLAYRRQLRPGYESDRFRLSVYDRASGEVENRSESLDRPITSITWSPDSSRLFFTAEDRGREPIFTVAASGGPIRMAVYGDASHDGVQLLPDGQSMIYVAESLSQPAEIYRGFSSGGAPQQLTHLNRDVFERFQLGDVEEITYDGTSDKISAFLVKPPGFKLDQRYPLLLFIHGGPQGAWSQSWSYRWNPQVFAGAGYVVLLPNPRGSTGYGQSFTDRIRGDWGEGPFSDLMAGVDAVIARPYVDATRLAAAGGSYGGYMVNWTLGHTNRFRALVSHAGLYDLPSFFGATEELWFPLWDLRGAPWDQPDLYQTLSPSHYVDQFKTPTLVIHGQQDFRVPVEQGMQLFTALQTHDVPSKLLYYPDEGHWVLSPRNSQLWHQTTLDWLNQWTKP